MIKLFWVFLEEFFCSLELVDIFGDLISRFEMIQHWEALQWCNSRRMMADYRLLESQRRGLLWVGGALPLQGLQEQIVWFGINGMRIIRSSPEWFK